MIKIDKPINTIALFITTRCNLNCKYCYIKKTNKDMSLETAKNSVLLIANSPGEEKEIHFLGGEPLLRPDFIKDVAEFAESVNEKIKFKITTNGTPLNRKVADFLKAKNFNVVVSLDGQKETHNLYRSNISCADSYDVIGSSLNLLKERNIKFSLSMTVAPPEAKKLYANYLHLTRKHPKELQINPSLFMKWNEREIKIYLSQAAKCIQLKRSLKHNLKLNILNDNRKKRPTCPIQTEICVTPKGDMVLCALFMKYRIIPRKAVIGNVNSYIGKGYAKCEYDKKSAKCIKCNKEKYCNKFCYLFDSGEQSIHTCRINSHIPIKNNNSEKF